MKRGSEQTREDENCNERKANKPVHGNPLRTFERHCKFQFRKTKPPPKLSRRSKSRDQVTQSGHATTNFQASIALNACRAHRRRSSPLERPCELLAEFLEPRVAPVRSAGSPVAGLKLRQKIVHRCNETKTFYVSTRSQKCLVQTAGCPETLQDVVTTFELTVSPHACANGIEHFCAAVKLNVGQAWVRSGNHAVVPFRDTETRRQQGEHLIRVG